MSFVEEIVYLVQNIFISKLLKVSLMARCGHSVKNVTEKNSTPLLTVWCHDKENIILSSPNL